MRCSVRCRTKTWPSAWVHGQGGRPTTRNTEDANWRLRFGKDWNPSRLATCLKAIRRLTSTWELTAKLVTRGQRPCRQAEQPARARPRVRSRARKERSGSEDDSNRDLPVNVLAHCGHRQHRGNHPKQRPEHEIAQVAQVLPATLRESPKRSWSACWTTCAPAARNPVPEHA